MKTTYILKFYIEYFMSMKKYTITQKIKQIKTPSVIYVKPKEKLYYTLYMNAKKKKKYGDILEISSKS